MMGAMITRELAETLAAAGLVWEPASGDRFLVPDRDLDEEVFVVSGMSVEVSDLPTGPEMRFNGTVEWALDSIGQHEVVWLPREDQLRDALGVDVEIAGAVREHDRVAAGGSIEPLQPLEPVAERVAQLVLARQPDHLVLAYAVQRPLDGAVEAHLRAGGQVGHLDGHAADHEHLLVEVAACPLRCPTCPPARRCASTARSSGLWTASASTR